MENQLGMLFGDGLGGVPWIIICSKARWSRDRIVDEDSHPAAVGGENFYVNTRTNLH